jgi:hypothetical protein
MAEISFQAASSSYLSCSRNYVRQCSHLSGAQATKSGLVILMSVIKYSDSKGTAVNLQEYIPWQCCQSSGTQANETYTSFGLCLHQGLAVNTNCSQRCRKKSDWLADERADNVGFVFLNTKYDFVPLSRLLFCC